MARIVREVMNRELLAVRPDLPASEVRELIRAFGVGAVPVVDDAGGPLGVVSLRDLFEPEGTAAGRMTRPAICLADSTPIEEAARRLARTAVHHLVVVDGSGMVVGMLSCVDLLRGLLGMAAPHPSTFPHWDHDTQVSWTDEWPLDEAGCAKAPQGPGVLVLLTGEHGQRDTVVWAEDCADVRARASALLARRGEQEMALARLLECPGLRARASLVAGEESRRRVVRILHERLRNVPPPGAT